MLKTFLEIIIITGSIMVTNDKDVATKARRHKGSVNMKNHLCLCVFVAKKY